MTLKCSMTMKNRGKDGKHDKDVSQIPLSLNTSFLLTQASVQVLQNKFILTDLLLLLYKSEF